MTITRIQVTTVPRWCLIFWFEKANVLLTHVLVMILAESHTYQDVIQKYLPPMRSFESR